MKKNERKLTEKELKRKEKFEILRADMQKNGYKEKTLTIGVLQANVGAIFVMLPFIAVTSIIYFNVNPVGAGEISIRFSMFLIPILLALTVLHELIHGLVWSCFARNHFHSIEFGVIWEALTPYCTCSEPMRKWQYILGTVMPTLVLGAGIWAIGVATSQLLLFVIGELMIFSGGGDFLIILKILLYPSGSKETVYYDHPYECGVVVFEKRP